MADIVISEFMDEDAVATLADGYEVLYDPHLVDDPDALARAVCDAKALIVRNRTQVREKLLASAKVLKAVGRLGVGLDNIDLDACARRGIAVLPAKGANDDAVAEYVIATAMILLRGCYFGSAQVAAGRWPRQAMIGREIMGATIGFIGFGGIARATARRAKALGMKVAAYDPLLSKDADVWRDVRRCATLQEVLSAGEVVSVHVPLNAQTRGLIDAPALALMKEDAVLINTARGGVVDEDALVHALKSGKLQGAAMDVFEDEPLSVDGGKKYAGLDNIILTAHIAGVTAQSNVRVSALTAENVLRVLGG
ncbi:hydroxyacid dehydrogenase [Varunaivibrio sulfuroxidans]|uniref:(S)-sulfolactate dehydrogenase n=1 Tax=Varunaivibrio sulfuroxidans TaxID=1773489 RepID=A0A4R3JAR4_9PROT|nr:hydroxyacid dehydrogenase [Varunaivibrio sulfuroxidans]TCS63089.1 (S)-sulfolactate dehydrogenase [Varunaivibrio sulfuroxidans]WES31839.1 hydroxyacid dehydrogenase [Varunaivibrio sulfuroxidans]